MTQVHSVNDAENANGDDMAQESEAPTQALSAAVAGTQQAGPLVRLAVRRRLRKRLAEAKRGKGKAAKVLSKVEQEDLFQSVTDESIDAAYSLAVAEEQDATRFAAVPVGGPFIDWIINGGLVERIVEILLQLLLGV